MFLSRQNIVQRNTLVTDTILVLRYHPLFKSSKGIPNHIHHGVADGRSCVGQELHAARCIELWHGLPQAQIARLFQIVRVKVQASLCQIHTAEEIICRLADKGLVVVDQAVQRGCMPLARNDGIDRTSARNLAVSDKAVGNTQQHNEREKDSYRNPDIIPQRAAWNVHFKKPAASYTDLFAQLEANGTISTRGLKPDATHYCELIFDVNSAYFDNHGGYEFAKQFYEDAYKAAVQIVGGEQYILSAVMHADEINRAMTEALGREVYHYHLHVVYVPVVEKQILWSKRCKDKALVGTVKETVMQVSRSKKWASKPLLDDAGKPVLQKNGKPVLKKSYSILQDDFFNYMHNAGYTDVERGERGSTEEHLTVTQFKVQREQKRLDSPLLIYIVLVVLFAYFYTSITFNPLEVANNMKKSGGFIPGVRPGKPTSDFLNNILNYIVFIGATGLVIVCIVPIIASGLFNVGSLSFGGTSLIIIAGVILETIKAVDSMMLVRNYKGFLND